MQSSIESHALTINTHAQRPHAHAGRMSGACRRPCCSPGQHVVIVGLRHELHDIQLVVWYCLVLLAGSHHSLSPCLCHPYSLFASTTFSRHRVSLGARLGCLRLCVLLLEELRLRHSSLQLLFCCCVSLLKFAGRFAVHVCLLSVWLRCGSVCRRSYINAGRVLFAWRGAAGALPFALRVCVRFVAVPPGLVADSVAGLCVCPAGSLPSRTLPSPPWEYPG